MAVVFRYGRYYIDYRPDGRYGRRIFQKLPEGITLEQARLIEQEMRLSLDPRQGTPPVPENIKVDDLFPEYLAWYELFRARSSHKDVTSIYENHLSRLLGNEKLMALNAHHILAYQRRRKAEKRKTRGVEGTVSNRTIMKELDYFSGFLTWCRREKKLAVPEIRIEPLPYERPIPMVLSPDEVAGIIEAAEPVYKALFLCLYSLGLRLAEARNIRGQDVDMKYNVVRVIQKGGTYKLLPLNDWVRAALKPLIPKEPKAYIFENPRTGEPYINLRKAIDRACKRAGVTKHVTAHLFRHSIATHFLAQDVNLRTIQQYLGHSQVQTTEFYTHVAVGHLRSASDGLFKGVSAGLSTKTPTGSG